MGKLRLLKTGHGDLCLAEWDAQRPDTVAHAEAAFAEHFTAGRLAFRLDGPGRTTSIRQFDRTAPEILLAALTQKTNRIRLGSGGVMLVNHAPLMVAERFKVLEALFPGRIDLGLGRAPGTDPVTSYALRRRQDAREGDDFLERFQELMLLERGGFTVELADICCGRAMLSKGFLTDARKLARDGIAKLDRFASAGAVGSQRLVARVLPCRHRQRVCPSSRCGQCFSGVSTRVSGGTVG